MYSISKSAFIKLFVLMTVLVAAGYLLVYQVTLKKVDDKYKNKQGSSGGSVSISTADLQKDFVSLQQDSDNPQAGNLSITGGVQGSTLTSTVQDGTSPINVNSPTLVQNLNADMVDGKNAEDLSKPASNTTVNNITHTSTGESIPTGTNTQYFRGDKSWQTLNTSVVQGLGSLATSDSVNNDNWSGTELAVSNGGTGAIDSVGARTNLGLGNVENMALSLWGGSTNIASLGTVAQGTWNGNVIQDVYIDSATNWNTAYSQMNQWDGGATGLVVATGRTSLGLGSLATASTINNGNWSGTQLAVANGGTGATDAAGARTNLGLGTIANQNANSVAITGGSITGTATFNAGAVTSSGAIQGVSVNTSLVQNNSADLTLQTNTSGNIVLLPAENVGIGVADASYKLEVSGSIKGDEIRTKERSAQPMVTFAFDDGLQTDYTVMKPVFDAQGEVAVAAPYTDKIGLTDPNQHSTYAELTALKDSGWEIASHTKSHAHLSTLTEPEIRTELADSKQTLRDNGFNVTSLVYPYVHDNELVRRITRDYYRAARGALTSGINTGTWDTYALKSKTLSDTGVGGIQAKIDTLKANIDTAYSDNGWVIFYGHGTDSSDATAMAELIDYVQAKSGMDIVTMEQALNRAGNILDVSDAVAVGSGGLRASLITGDTQLDGTLTVGTAPSTQKLTVSGDGLFADNSSLDVEKVVNGDFATNGTWTWGTGWSHDAVNLEADHTTTDAVALEQNISSVSGEIYYLTFEVKNRTKGAITPQIGGAVGIQVQENGTYTQTIVSGGTGNLKFVPVNIIGSIFDGSIDNVSVKKITGGEIISGGNIIAGGNIGIGDNTPNAKLEIQKDTTLSSVNDYAIRITQPSATVGLLIGVSSATSNAAFMQAWDPGAGTWTRNLVLQRQSGTNVGIGVDTPTSKLEVRDARTSGTLFTVGAPWATTLAGTLTGAKIDLSTSYTATGQSMNGQTISLPAVTNTGSGTYTYKGLAVSGGAIVQNTAAGTDVWNGLDITMPNITQTTGTVRSTGVKITGGTVTSGSSYAFTADANAGNVGIGTATPANKLTVNAPVTADTLATTIITPTVATNKGLVVQGYTSQTADLIQAQSSAGAIVFKIDTSGNLTAQSATFTGTLTMNGHIITGNASGSTTIAAGAGAGTGPSVSITGNDTSGTMTVTTGTGPAAGVLATVTFAGAYGSAPNVVIAPKTNANGATLQYYTIPGTTNFTLNSGNAPTASTAYTYSYHVMQ